MQPESSFTGENFILWGLSISEAVKTDRKWNTSTLYRERVKVAQSFERPTWQEHLNIKGVYLFTWEKLLLGTWSKIWKCLQKIHPPWHCLREENNEKSFNFH